MKSSCIVITTASATVGLLLSACGATSFSNEQNQPQGFNLGATQEVLTPDDSNPSSNDSLSSVSSGATRVIEMRVGGYGYNTAGTPETTVEVRANQVLKVQFTPGIQDKPALDINLVPHYSGLGVYLQVGDAERPTPFLHNGYAGTQAESSPIYDFTDSFSRTCSKADPTCRQMITLIVKMPNYDHYLLTYPYAGFSTWTHVVDTHPWNGTLRIQTDDTDAL